MAYYINYEIGFKDGECSWCNTAKTAVGTPLPT